MSDIGGQRAGWVIKDLGSKIEIDKRCSFTSIELINVREDYCADIRN